MNTWVWGLLGLVVGVAVTIVVTRLVDAARSAAVVAERDLLRLMLANPLSGVYLL